MTNAVDLEKRFGAANYAPLPVTIVRGEGVHLWDDKGRRYLDMLGAYSAVSFGHCHPRLVRALTEQAGRLDIISVWNARYFVGSCRCAASAARAASTESGPRIGNSLKTTRNPGSPSITFITLGKTRLQ